MTLPQRKSSWSYFSVYIELGYGRQYLEMAILFDLCRKEKSLELLIHCYMYLLSYAVGIRQRRYSSHVISSIAFLR